MSSMIDLKVLGGLFLVLGISGVITVSLVYKLSGGEIPFQYGIILDAGSTKVQATLYKWEGQKDQGTGIVSQVDACRREGGLHEIRDLYNGIDDAVLSCLENVSRSLSKEQQAKTPLYLGATAGMRLLRLANPLLADAIILGVKYTLLKNTDFLVKDVGIIDGKDEGIFAWVTTNFLLDALHSEVNDPASTYGALDMGGASTQISFEMPPRSIEDTDNATTVKLQLYGQDHLVFGKSYLCFGINEAMRRYRAMLTLGKDPKNSITDPCGFKGDTVTYTADYLFNHQCTKTFYTEEKKDAVYKFTGTGNNEACSTEVAKITNQEQCRKLFNRPCFSAPEEKLSNVEYMAVSTFYFTASALNITNTTLENYKNAIDSYCSLTKTEAESMLKPYEIRYVRDYCLEAHYVHHILTKEYGFNDTTWENIKFVMKVGKSDLGWSLGYMINATNAIPKGKPATPLLSQSTVVILLVLFSLLTIAAVLMLLLFPRRHQSSITVLPK